jgi:hypothetical protein
VLESEFLGHVRGDRRRTVALARVVAAGDEGDAGLACEVGLRFRNLAGDVGLGTGCDGRLEVALGAAGAPGAAAVSGWPAWPMKPRSCSPKRPSMLNFSLAPSCALLPNSGCASSGRW